LTRWFIVPINKTAIQSAATYPLLPVPTNDKSLFPNSFLENKHPVIITHQFRHDIRQGSLIIEDLLASEITIPYVDRLKDWKTPFVHEVVSYIGGANGQDLMGLAPGTLFGLPKAIRYSKF
jgi:hypothetical protein